MAIDVALVKAAGVLTATANFTANDTVIVGGVTYKFVASPASANDIDIGGTLTVSLTNLALALNGEGTPGATTYHEDTVPCAAASAVSTATTLTLTARFGGTWGNNIEFREGVDGGAAFSISTAMAAGAGNFAGAGGWVARLLALNPINSEVQRHLRSLTEAAD